MGDHITADQARTLAHEAYVFGFPLVYIDTQIQVLSHVTKPVGTRAPLNQFAHYREFPDASNRSVVGFNVDTLYSLAQLDLSDEPMVLSVPEMGERYWIMQIVDGWNNVPHAPGSRTVGNKAGDFAIIGPDWDGELPGGVEELRIPTNIAIVAGRTYTGGPSDYVAVHALQDQYRLVPLSAWGKDYTPPEEVPLRPGVEDGPVGAQVQALPAESFINRLAQLLVHNSPEPADPPLMARIAELGIKPGETFSLSAFDSDIRTAIEDGVSTGQQAIRDEERKLGEHVNGWNLSRDLGRYGTAYTYRAAWTFFGVGGNLVEDAFYPLSLVDGDSEPYDGENRYELRFTQQQLPPVDAFWSVTMYDTDSYLVANPINRYALGDRSKLSFAEDGSLTIHIQHDPSGDEAAANWLPAPRNGFKLALRLYQPKPEVIDGSWTPPPVRRVA